MPIESRNELQRHLEWAIAIERVTIPLYLYAMYSLKDNGSETCALIRSIAVEEMLHVSLAANLLLSVGGTPDFCAREQFPVYPGPIPHHRQGFNVSLERFSPDLVENVFMQIELPTEVDAIPEDNDFDTIGQFYMSIALAFEALDKSGDLFRNCQREKQLGDPKYYGAVEHDSAQSGNLMVVDDLTSAQRALEYIVRQGEGLRSEHFADPAHRELAHYFKFQEIVRRWLKDPSGVWPVAKDPRSAEMGARPKRLAALFNACYSYAFITLEEIYSTSDEKLKDRLVGRLYLTMKEALPMVARELVQLPMTMGASENAGPPFEYYQFIEGEDIVAQILELATISETELPVLRRLRVFDR